MILNLPYRTHGTKAIDRASKSPEKASEQSEHSEKRSNPFAVFGF
jgi:hypothetical protein